ncbi:hypothetical protein LVQ78_10135 [Buttiauxella sp. A2-C2_NF]|uniref:hypothetical protein n=1 Tax=Buttiauxella ferragutiae TaxID=82989 RepID=UPI001E64DCBB|nr:hypothetical protein [Buttiauxella ferragutiae]MCE0826388.1 hypothetical protein [Buttiauxella ferragutiae]
MDIGNWVLEPNTALTRFCVSPPREEQFAEFFAGEAMDMAMDYRFQNGSGPQEDAFCRRIFRQQMAERTVELSEAIARTHVSYTGESDTVSFSSFQRVPFHVQRWLELELHATEAGSYPFQLSTCGGARLWCNEQAVAKFTPFSRNKMQSCELMLPLQAGKNTLLIHLEELFERDTVFALRFIYQGCVPLGVSLPQTDAAVLDELSLFAGAMRPELTARDNQVRIRLGANAPTQPVSLSGEIHGMGNDNFTPRQVDFGTATPDGQLLTLSLPAEIGSAHYQIVLRISCAGVSITRSFGVNLIPSPGHAEHSTSLDERKLKALRHTARHGMERTSRLLAMLQCGETTAEADRLLLDTLKRISAREDCSDFSLVPLLWIWREHNGEHFPAALWRRVRSSILGYRYWMDEQGNDVMWFWSENHTLCFHTAQYLAGQMFPNELFLASGRSGEEQRAIAALRLAQWFDAIELYGFVEWNSAPYYPVDYIGLFALYQLAEDAWVRQRAKGLIDRLMLLSSLHYQDGIAAGTMGRVYEKELLAGVLTELSAYGNVAWGGGWYNRKCASLPLFCASDYQPPVAADSYARLSQGSLSAFYQAGGGNIVVWKEPGVSLSSCINHHPGQRGHQQHLMDVQFATHHDAKFWVNHPGEAEPGGEQRPSYWSGNGVLPQLMQVENRALQFWQLPADTAFPWTHLYLPADAFEQVITLPRTCLVRAGNAFAVIGCSAPLNAVTTGMTAGNEYRAQAHHVAWFTEVGHGDDAAFAAFCQRMETLVVSIEDQQAVVSTAQGELMRLDWQGKCLVEGVVHRFPDAAGCDPIVTWSGEAQ